MGGCTVEDRNRARRAIETIARRPACYRVVAVV